MTTGTLVLATEHIASMVAIVSIETGDRLLTLRADLESWRRVPPYAREEGGWVEFDHEGDSLLGIDIMRPGRIGLHATQRHPRWDKGETWATVRKA